VGHQPSARWWEVLAHPDRACDAPCEVEHAEYGHHPHSHRGVVGSLAAIHIVIVNGPVGVPILTDSIGDGRNPLWKKLKEERRARQQAGSSDDPTAKIDLNRTLEWRRAEIERCRSGQTGELIRGLSAEAEGDYWLKRWSWMPRYDRKLLLRWRLGRRPGRAVECTRCCVAGKRTTREHVLECLGPSTERENGRLIVDQLLAGARTGSRRQQFNEAMEILRHIEAAWVWPRWRSRRSGDSGEDPGGEE
jgi:hypothetical protein